MSSASHTLRNTAHSTLAVWVEFLLGMVASIIIARSLEPDTYGQYSFLMWCSTLFVIAANGGLTTAVIKFVAEADSTGSKAQVLSYLNRIQHGFLLTVALLAIGVAMIWPTFFSASASWSLWWLMLAAASLKAAYIFRMSASKGREDFAAISRVMLMVGPVNILLCLLAAWRYPSLAGFVWVYALTSMLYLLLMSWQGRTGAVAGELDAMLRQRIWRHLRITSASILLSFLVLRQSEVFFLKLLRPVEEIGYFNIAFTLGFALAALIPGAYSALLLPMMSRQSAEAREQQGLRMTNSLRYLQLLALPMAAGTYVLGPLLVGVLYGADYAPAANVLAWIITGVALAALGQAGVSQLVSGDRQHSVLMVNLVVTALVLALDWWAIHRFGLVGAGAAFLAGNLLHSAAMLGMALNRLKTPWCWSDTFRVLVATAAAGVATHWAVITLEGLPPLAIMLAGAVLFVLVYLPATWLVGCWHAEEQRFIRELLKR